MCRAKALRLRVEREQLVQQQQGAETKKRKVDVPDFFPPLPPFVEPTLEAPTLLNAADKEWMRLYLKRRDLSSSLIDDILPLCSLQTQPRFHSATGFFGFVDSLPGPEFRVSRITLPTVPGEAFDFAYLPILDVVKQFISQFNGSFLDPLVEEASIEREPEFVDGERFRRLQKRLHDAVGPEAVLMPLIFSSGPF